MKSLIRIFKFKILLSKSNFKSNEENSSVYELNTFTTIFSLITLYVNN
jgi:hypothetical protein